LLQLGVTVIFSWPATVITATVVAFPLMYKNTGSFEQIDANLSRLPEPLGRQATVFWGHPTAGVARDCRWNRSPFARAWVNSVPP